MPDQNKEPYTKMQIPSNTLTFKKRGFADKRKKKQMKKLINLNNKRILKELTLTFLGLCWNEETASPT